MIDKLRGTIEKYTEEISKEYYLQGAGLKDEIKFSEIYGKYPDVHRKSNIEEIKGEIELNKDNPEEKRRLTMLLENMYVEVIGSNLTELSEKYMKTESEGTIEVDGKEMFYRSSVRDLVNSESREHREKLSAARDNFISEKLNPILEGMYYKEKELIQGFGFNNKIDMFGSLSGIDLYELNSNMQKLLVNTEDVYKDLMSYYAKKEGITPGEIKKHDLSFILRGKNFDKFFPQSGMVESMRKFVSKMGIDITADNHIIFDLENREKKSPRAFCSPVRIPYEVYLVISPRGGEDDYSTFLHELGHALHYANIKNDIGFEYKWYGDNSVTEGYAMSLDHLTLNPLWMDKILDVKYDLYKDYFIHRNFRELVMLRRYAGKINYELQLASANSLEKMPDLYNDTLSSASHVHYGGANYLTDVDSYFYVARYLRAWMFQSNLHKCMTEKFNEDWFVNPSSGDFLKELWSIGQKYNADELLKMNNCSSLSVDPLLTQINSVLNN